ncbi:endonuclease/exonuclease/phosphatase [Nibribacter ruber]|uniref:Endonuclease/exonuclease/phosphatase n=1 Tax=Nibribacter ruber TaxID=2698458 RepID=A0A6P1NXE9_9BACT|nr:endonuclease/exonuclease/phosphatase family protein [Nibribacter ruber]QHL87690.1 endonuclease/exonuclease/phosphatase [Nibribacter ruber]
MLKTLLSFLTMLSTGWLLVGVLCQYVPPHVFWPAGFIAMSLPGALLFNFVMGLLWLWKKPLWALLPLGLIVLFWSQHTRYFTLNTPDAQPLPEQQRVTVLSYNVRVFNVYKHLHAADPGLPEKEMQWVASHPADILCLQEFYYDKKHKQYNSKKRIGTSQGREMFLGKALTNRIGAEFGLAIFSRFPIVNKGHVEFDRPTKNQVIFVDVKLPNKDTLRVYNMHLESMSIEEKEVEAAVESEAAFKTKGRGIARRLKGGFIARSHQVQRLIEHLQESPYPVLICGDLNDVPSSYTYQQLRRHLDNAFEAGGSGFGFTYNGKLPLRIDNQFFSPSMQLLRFDVLEHIPYSDHFPLESTYVMEKRPEQEVAE